MRRVMMDDDGWPRLEPSLLTLRPLLLLKLRSTGRITLLTLYQFASCYILVIGFERSIIWSIYAREHKKKLHLLGLEDIGGT
jgi:hypothetical protein